MRAGFAAIGAALVVAGCTSPSAGPGTGGTTVTSTQTLTRPAPSTSAASPVVPKPFALAAVVVPARPPGQPLPKGEVDGSCPYIKAGLNIEPEPTGNNFADLEGNRVQRVTRLTTLKPMGCRFYFEDDYHPTGDILPMTYSSATEAYNAMVTTAKAGSSVQGVPSFVPGVDGISFQTRFNAPDAGQDWAFVFAKGKVLVVIRTDQNKNLPADAENIAKAIVDRF
jgi:hypothetical protein